MNSLPTEIEDIIYDYRNQLEHTENFKPATNILDNFSMKKNNHTIHINDTVDFIDNSFFGKQDELYISYCSKCGEIKNSTAIIYDNQTYGFDTELVEGVIYDYQVGSIDNFMNRTYIGSSILKVNIKHCKCEHITDDFPVFDF